MTEENINESKTEFKDKIPYANELMRRIAIILDAIDHYQDATLALYNLHAILTPEIKNAIYKDITVIRKHSAIINSRFIRTTVITMPRRISRNTGIKISVAGFEDKPCTFGTKKEEFELVWNDFGLSKEFLMNIFKPGQCIQTPTVITAIHNAFAIKEIEIIIPELHKYGLLLLTGKAVAQGSLSLVALGENEDANVG